MSLIHSFILGLVQGITEFLPVSSSGQLVLVEAFIAKPYHHKMLFEVVTNFGTLCSILVFYRHKIAAIILSWINIPRSSQPISEQWKTEPNLRLTWYIIISMIPAGIVGFTLQDAVQARFLNPFMVCVFLMVTGIVLFLTRFRKHSPYHVDTKRAFVIGIAQAIAVLPGISRSGSTISTGIYLGINRKEMPHFSFLMSIPISVGAMLLAAKDMASISLTINDGVTLLIGFCTAFFFGYFALKWFISILQSRGIYHFCWYCWAVGIAGLIYFW
jgi:undecaprenyl-diphosphatase